MLYLLTSNRQNNFTVNIIQIIIGILNITFLLGCLNVFLIIILPIFLDTDQVEFNEVLIGKN